MPALLPTDFTCEIIYLGFVHNRKEKLGSESISEAFASFAGFERENHSGLTRAACSRVSSQHPSGTKIRNVRQFSIISAEEMELVSAEMGIEAVKPEWMGASIMVRGLPDFTYIPPSSRLQNNAGTTLVVDMENHPCMFPGKEEVELYRFMCFETHAASA